MNILLATEVIHPGGAETFVLRLADALQQRGHDVEIFVFYKDIFNKKLHTLLAPSVPVTFARIPYSIPLRKIDSLLFRLNIDFSLRDYFIKHTIQKRVKEAGIDVIHSHLLKTDRLSLKATAGTHIPVVTTIHGDYLQFYDKTEQQKPIPLLNYSKKAAKNISALDRIICISDKQIDFFEKKFEATTANKIQKIYNGYEGFPAEDAKPLKNKLGIPQDAFVFGMVSRGIPEKGWDIAIRAFIQLNNPNTHLVLVGHSEYLSRLEMQYAGNKNIHFTGHSDKPLDWISIMNVGLLPTTYASESLPTAVIEYLCCGIPVIASDAGEIINMLCIKDKAAGTITPIVNGMVDVNQLFEAMEKYITDTTLYTTHRRNAVHCYELFDMNKCVSAYVAAYANAIAQKSKRK